MTAIFEFFFQILKVATFPPLELFFLNGSKCYTYMQGGPLPVVSRVKTPLMGIIVGISSTRNDNGKTTICRMYLLYKMCFFFPRKKKQPLHGDKHPFPRNKRGFHGLSTVCPRFRWDVSVYVTYLRV